MLEEKSNFGEIIGCQVSGKSPASSARTSNTAIQTASSRSGLTLIEVLLALVILGTGLVALVTAAGRCISVARQAKNFETARELLAVVEVEKPMMLEEQPEDIAANGTFEGNYSAFRWKRSIAKEGFEGDGLWKVTTEIFWTENDNPRHESVVQLLYWPEGKGGSPANAP